MPEPNLEQIAVRLACLEQRCEREARIKRVLAGILVGSVIFTIGTTLRARSTQSSSDRISAREIVLVDQKGQARARLAIGQGGLSLVMSDAGGLPRIALGVSEKGDPQISLLGKRKGFPRANWFQVGDDFQGLIFEDEASSFINLLHTGREARLQTNVVGVGGKGGSESTFGFFVADPVVSNTPSLGAQLVQDGKVLWRVPVTAGRGK